MAAAEVPTEAEARKRKMGPFEELCLSGLPFEYQEHLPEKAVELWKKMVHHKQTAFLPMDHLSRAFDILAVMAGHIHVQAETLAFLISGPKGIGKTTLFRVFVDVMNEDNLRATDGKLTLCFRSDLSERKPENTECFHRWLLRSVVEVLRSLKRDLDVAEALDRLARTANGGKDDNVWVEKILNMAPSDTDTSSTAHAPLSPRVLAALKSFITAGRLQLANALLKEAQVGVIVVVDEAECMFQGSFFTRGCAETWRSQLLGVISMQYPVIGVVVCSSFQRSRQLFLSDGEPPDFPPEYTHAELRANWNETRLEHLRLGDAMWAEDSLKAFLLIHTCKVADPSFTLYRGQAETQAPGAAVDATQEPSGAAAKEEKQPSEAALEMARKLDALFLQRWKGEDELSEEKLDLSLEQVLELYGSTPRDLARAASTLFQERESSSPWQECQSPEVTEDLDESSEDLK